jgi:hypothetical protein
MFVTAKRSLTISAATMMLFAISLASAPAKADHNFGPVRNGDQCWYNANKRHPDFGYWAACPASSGAVMRLNSRGNYEWVDDGNTPRRSSR